VDAAPRSIGARELLDESERLWLSDTDSALREAPSPGSTARMRLVLESLAAYVRLLRDHDAHVDPLTVFRRWPACTVVALARLAGGAEDRVAVEEAFARIPGTGAAPASTWFAGWGACWQQLHGQAPGGTAPYDAPGVPLLLHLSELAATLDVAPELRVHPPTGALAIVFPGAPGRGARVEAGGGECPVAEDRWVLPRPVLAANCFDALGNVHRVHVVDPRDPLLVFDEDGTLIPDDAPLPAGDVWMVHLGEPPDDAFDGVRHVVEEGAPPIGWSRWWLGRVSLASTKAVRSIVSRGGELRDGPWRPVASTERADLLFDVPIEGVIDRDGDVVYATAPRLRLPGGPGDVWTIEVRRWDATTPNRWSAPGGSTVTLSDRLPQPALGRFIVQAHAPSQRPVSAAFSLAEAVALDASPRIRLLEPGGLTPVRAVIRAPRGVHPVPSVLKLGSTEIRSAVRLHIAGSDATFDLSVELPWCAVRNRTGSRTGEWGAEAQTFTLEDLDEAGAVDVRLPRPIIDEIGVPDLLAASRPDDAGGQRIRGRRLPGGDVYRYPLGSLTDAVRLNGATALWLLLPGHAAKVGTIRGCEPASGAVISGHRLVLRDRRPGARLTVRVCAPMAPWLEPHITALDEDSDAVELDTAFAGRSLLVTVADAGVELTRWPRPGWEHPANRTFRVAGAATLPAVDSRSRRDVAYYLAGLAPLPRETADLSLVWLAAARATSLLEPGLGALTAQECAARLGDTPTASLQSARLGAEETIESLIRGGLAAHGVRSVGAPTSTATLWPVAPLAALLLTSPLLPYLATAPAWDPAELDDAERHLLDVVRVHCAPEVVALLTAPERAPRELDPSDAVSTPEVDEALRDVLAFGGSAPQALLFESLRARTSGPAALSYGCALLARITAQGDEGAAALERRIRHLWVGFAQRDPRLAAHHLVESEFAVSGWYAHHA
jgi:hypothetical protein